MKEFSIEERKKICNKCPILTNDGRCNPSLWINPDTDEISTYSKTGFFRGCNWFVFTKMKNVNNHCIAGKW